MGEERITGLRNDKCLYQLIS